ncbi:MAG: hypothetical protein V4858_27165 [Pseudomonadota bacterium]
MKIAIVGAPGTGKSSMVEALRLALQADANLAGCTVSESWTPEQQRSYDLTLLMGLDLPQQANGTGPSPTQCDAHLRQLLDNHSQAYAVVYGMGQARTDCALQVIQYQHTQSSTRPRPAPSAWHWNCETCSDADCEHRLFSALLLKDSVRR